MKAAGWHWHADSGQWIRQDVTSAAVSNLILPCKISRQQRSEPSLQQTRSSIFCFPYCESVSGNSKSVRHDCLCGSHGGKTPLIHSLSTRWRWVVSCCRRSVYPIGRPPTRNWVEGWGEGAPHGQSEKVVASGVKQTAETDVGWSGIKGVGWSGIKDVGWSGIKDVGWSGIKDWGEVG